jgi:hypothetical protein
MKKQLQEGAPANQRVEKRQKPEVNIPTKGTVAPNGMRFS